MKDIIIFDTNSIRNTGVKEFLGGREMLRQLAPDAEFYMPELVLDELKRQKKREFQKVKDQLLNNGLVKLFNPDLSEILEFNIDEHLGTLQDNESFAFEVIPCVHGEVIDQFRSMAILNEPPFNKDSDKGFKDACIYISILNYLPHFTGRSVFFWGNDGRLKDAFSESPDIRGVDSIASYHSKSSRYLMDEYFFGVLSEELKFEVKKNHIESSWRNKEDNWVIYLNLYNKKILVEIDSREIVNKREDANLVEKINRLVTSPNFQTSHDAVADLLPLIPYLSIDDITLINQASEDNNQIYWIEDDDDMKEFFETLNGLN